MLIDAEACAGCEVCLPYCPMRAIAMRDGVAVIDRDQCVECGVCYRMNVCPTGAIQWEELEWPRILRREFSDPTVPHRRTGGRGRGTEEMKTNDVTGRYRVGEIGIAVEMGRPGTGARFRDFEKLTRALATKGIELEESNPIYELLANPQEGTLRPEVREEKVLSGIIEFKCPPEQVMSILELLKQAACEVDTVFSVDLIEPVHPDGTTPVADGLAEVGFRVLPQCKVNVGLGRPAEGARLGGTIS